MVSTVRISDTAKARLERLRTAWAQESGERPSQQEFLDLALEAVEREGVGILEKEDLDPDEEWSKIKALQGCISASPTSSQEIDDYLYGEDAVHGRRH